MKPKTEYDDRRGYDKCDTGNPPRSTPTPCTPTGTRQVLRLCFVPPPSCASMNPEARVPRCRDPDHRTPMTPKPGTPRSATTTTRVRLLPRRRLPRLLRLRTNDYFDYFHDFDYFLPDPKTVVPNPKIPDPTCDPDPNPIYPICVFSLKSCIIK